MMIYHGRDAVEIFQNLGHILGSGKLIYIEYEENIGVIDQFGGMTLMLFENNHLSTARHPLQKVG